MAGFAGFAWWQRGIIYHIYPRSLQDSNGDGIGDLPGITARLDYLQWLGVDAIWLSPIFTSPMADFGYDVSGYRAIHPMFGTLADFDRLVAAAHERGLKVILDYVPNHTSEQHPWFLESRAARHNPRRDWYIWRDPAPDGGPPNNWVSNFGGSAWEWDEPTGQYYYHAYLREQPDLNWRNPEVRRAMLDVLRFWLDRGVDGFRVDALRQVIKDADLRDNPPNPAHTPDQGPYAALLPVYSADRPEVHEIIRELRAVIDAYPNRLMIGELYLPLERLVAYYGEHGSGVHLPANFHLILTPWRAADIAALVDTYEGLLPEGAWPNWVLGNHDRHRIASRVGPEQARVAAILLLTLRGTPT
ncbi:MAG TPA: alpha-amylase family glycosyl hydrolase, partial [Thermomicrobiaceae bacterium]|nr:alpha-amylase family glycosyl hydrolase [Thermomicrobiaceae bacterium]